MAPPTTVLSYFRRDHRRAGSTPNSPESPQWQPPPSPTAADSLRSPSFRHFGTTGSANESPVSPLPPVLPPIPRVASNKEPAPRPHSISNTPSHTSSFSDSSRRQEKIPSQLEQSATPRILSRRLPDQEPLKIQTTIDPRRETGYRRRQWDSQAQAQVQDRAVLVDPASRRGSHTGVIEFAPKPSSISHDFAPRPATPSSTQSQNDLLPPGRQPPSPSSSMSSFHRSAASSHMAVDSSPASSKLAKPAPPSTASKPTKTKINLLNPVSLLKRRRASQNAEQLSEGSLSTSDVPAMNLPDDYDPRIKGKGVHDFSAPRPRRYHSNNDADSESLQVAGDASPAEEQRLRTSIPAVALFTESKADASAWKSPEKEHTPVFVENFDEDTETGTSAVNRESLANPGFLARMSKQMDLDSTDFVSRHIEAPPTTEVPPPAEKATPERTSKSSVGDPSVRVSSEQSTARSSITNETKATSPPTSPRSNKRWSGPNLELPFHTEALPKHLLSSASDTSRFSFQLNSDQTIAQEKALEEKGKVKAAAAIRASSIAESRYEDSDFEDMDDYDDMDDDTYEEPIPLLNDDVIEDESVEEGPHYSFDNDGGFGNADLDNDLNAEDDPDDAAHGIPGEPSSIRQNTQASKKSDDMYFDDGMIEDPLSRASQGFDESYFDTPVESPVDSRAATGPVPRFPPPQGLGLISASSNDIGASEDAHLGVEADGATAFNKLDDYHNALASAATKAAADGKFRRQASLDTSISNYSSETAPRKSDVSAEASGDILEEQSWTSFGYEQPDFDDEFDPIIAEANAEALACDESGFYGREFGFYGSTSDGGELYNGGYFGSGSDELRRSSSGMNASREPNLTPITERSEFSTRNSFVSLYGGNSLPGSAVPRNDPALPSPGLKELAARMSMEDDDMTLSQLMRLRKEAFGGGASAGASPPNSLPTGSPLAMQIEEEEEVEAEEYEWSTRDRDGFAYETDYVDWNPNDDLSPSSPTLALQTMGGDSLSNETTPRPKLSNGDSRTSLRNGNRSTSPTPPRRWSNSAHQQHSAPTQTQTEGIPMGTPSTFTTESPTSPPLLNSPQSATSTASSLPMPSPSLINKFAARPPASSQSYAERQRVGSGGSAGGGGDLVAYVMEDERWYLERRRRTSKGDVVVVGRELVEGGRI